MSDNQPTEENGATLKDGDSPASITVRFLNQNTNVADTDVHIMFGGGASITGTIFLGDGNTPQPLAANTDYTLDQIGSEGIVLNSFVGGKIFISFGASLTNSLQKGFPDFQYGSADPTAQVRWDKVEMTYQDAGAGNSGVNMSASDFFSIPLEVTSFLQGKQAGQINWHPQTPTAQVFSGLADLTNNQETQKYAVVAATSSNPNSVETMVNGVSQNVLRVISPANVNQGVANPYPAVNTAGTNSASVVGTYGGRDTSKDNPPPPLPAAAYLNQTYDFALSINASGDLLLTGSGEQVGQQTLTVKSGDLAKGLYSSDPPYTLSSTGSTVYTNSNSVYDQALSDIIAGYNLGLVGSAVVDPRAPTENIPGGTIIGTENTDAWYSRGPLFGRNKQLTPGQLFGALQTDAGNYNQYANFLSQITDAYSFPYTDKTAAPFLNLTPGAADSMTITILSD